MPRLDPAQWTENTTKLVIDHANIALFVLSAVIPCAASLGLLPSTE